MLRQLYRKLISKLSTLSRSRKLVFLATFFVITIVALLGSGFLHAARAADAPPPAVQPVSFIASSLLSGILYIINSLLSGLTRLFLSLIVFVLTFIIDVAGYNGYLSSTAVNVGWVMVRDLTNMIFVVIMLVIAFGTILGVEEYGWKHLLFKMIGMAILVNFSRTICGLIIDMAQVVMITFVNGIAATATSNIINAFGLTTLNSLSQAAPSSSITDVAITISYAAGLFIAATIFFALVGFIGMLVGRMVYLWVLIVLSPIAFTFSVLHETHHYAEEWRSEFIKQVITGPVLIFFLWLTLVTVGNGGIVAEITKNSAVADNQKVTAQLDGNIQTSGVGKALEWSNLANYVIAVAMLLIGLKTAGHLGGFGAEFVEHHAIEYGKKALELPAEYMPIIGKKALERRYETAKSLASMGLSKVSVFRNEGAKKLEKINKDLAELQSKKVRGVLTPAEAAKLDSYGGVSGAGKRALGFAGSVLGSLIESGGRADKRVKDWEDAAHAQHVIEEEQYSTSSNFAGRVKLSLGVQEHQLQQLSTEKKRQKFAEEELRKMALAHEAEHAGGSTFFGETEQNILKGRRDATRAEVSIKAGQQELEKKLGVYGANAEAEQREAEITAVREREVAKARDEYLVSKGRESEATNYDRVLDKQQKAKNEAQAVGDFVLAEARIDAQLSRINEIITAMQNGTATQKDLDLAEKGLNDMVTANYGRHAAFAMASNAKISKHLNRPMDASVEFDISDPAKKQATREALWKLQADDLSGLLRKNVNLVPGDEVDGLRNAVNELQERYYRMTGVYDSHDPVEQQKLKEEAESRMQADLRIHRESADVAAGQGHVGLAGLWNVKYDPAARKMKVDLTDVETDDGLKHVAGRRINALSGSKITSLGGGLSGSVDRNASGAVLNSTSSIDYAVKIISPLTFNQLSRVDEFTKRDMAEILENTLDARNGKLDAFLNKLRLEMKDKKAYIPFIKEATDRISDVAKKAAIEAAIAAAVAAHP